MIDPTPPDHDPAPAKPERSKPGKPKKLSVFLMWCYGLKVSVMFGVIVMLSTAPLQAVNGLLHEFYGEGHTFSKQPPPDSVLANVVYGIVALSITPYLLGWMYYNAREWFEVDHPDESVEEVFRPRV